ncbi:MAG TPA: aspartyl protease family protein [Sphingomicrobium sp.]|jgi:hypothetical protein
MAILTIGGAAPAPVVFDTGTDVDMLTESYASGLKLPTVGKSESIDLATGKRSWLPVVELGSVRLGAASLADTKVQLFETAADDSVGVFGPAAFGGRLVTLELGAGRLRVAPRDGGTMPQQAAEPFADNLPSATVEVGGMRVRAHLDSGSNTGLMLPKSMMNKVKLKAPARPGPTAYSASGSQQVYVGQLDGDLKIGSRIIHDPQVTFSGISAGANIGFAILRDMTLVIDTAGKRSWLLDPAVDVPAAAEIAGTYGPVTVRASGTGKLIVERADKAPAQLVSIGSALFQEGSTAERFQFMRTGGRVTGLRTISAGGRIATFAKTG